MESTKSLRGGSVAKLIAATALGMSLASYQAVAGPSASLQQARNGPVSAPISPVEYVNGNVGSGNSHFVEGQSATYRALMLELPVGPSITITLGYDIKHSGRHAIDYLTGFDRLSPHYYPGHVSQEVIDPLRGLSGVPTTYTEFPLPAPGSTRSPVPGMPTASFDKLPPADKMMRLYGGTITDVRIVSSGDLSADSSEAQVSVTFTATSSSAVLAWGGHIASRSDWPAGPDGLARSAAGISGSPYHMRLVGWTLGNLGRQDRSMSADQVYPPPPPMFTDFPANLTVSCASEVPAPDATLPKAIDYCGGVTISYKADVIESGSCANRFIVRRTYVATDACGNSTEKIQVIIVEDLTPPVFGAFPIDAAFGCAKDVPAADVGLVTASDTCGGPVTITVLADVRTDETCANQFTINRTYVATDICGNSSQKTQVLTVNDQEKPSIIVCPPDKLVYLDADGVAATNPAQTGSAVALDGCSGTVELTHTDLILPGSGMLLYTISRTWTAKDTCGNPANCVQMIQVRNGAPEITLQPESQTVALGESVIFCAAATGLEPITYQWRHNGVNIDGATNACFTNTSVSLTDGGTYTFLAGNAVGVAVSDPAVLNIHLPTIDVGTGEKPANDDFAGRIALLGMKGTFASYNRKATFETKEPVHAGKKGGKSVWFTWKAPVTGVATIKTSGSVFDTLLGVYTGSALDKLVAWAADEDTGGFYTSIVRFNMIKGREYHVAVDGFAGQEGSFVFDYELIDKPHLMQVFPVQPLSQTVPEGSDVTFEAVAVRVCGNGQQDCPSPAHYPEGELPTLSYQWYFEGEPLAGATRATLTIPNAQPEDVGRYQLCVYSKWEANCSAVAVLQVYSGEATLPNVLAFDKLEDAENSPPLEITAGTENPDASSPPGLISVQSTVVSGYSGTLVFNTTGSASGPLEVICGVIGGASQWVNFVPQAAGTLKINTRNSTYDTVIACYRRSTTNPAVLDLITCNNNYTPPALWAQINVPVLAGQTNFILVDGVNGASGTLRLNYTNVVTTATSSN